MVEIVICDHDSAFADQLFEKIHKEFKQHNIEIKANCLSDGSELMRNYDPNVQLYFLDAQLPEISGLDAAMQIRKKNPSAVIIFVSSYEKAVFESFRCQPLRFIRKKRLSEELPEAIQEFVNRIRTEKPSALIRTNVGEMWIRISELIYVESNSHYLNFHCMKMSYRVHGMLSDYYEKLKPFFFIQPSKNFLVNCSYITDISLHEIQLQNGITIKISLEQEKSVKETYDSFVFNKIPAYQ